jgi:hypothetical protein
MGDTDAERLFAAILRDSTTGQRESMLKLSGGEKLKVAASYPKISFTVGQNRPPASEQLH